MRISDCSSDVCSSDLLLPTAAHGGDHALDDGGQQRRLSARRGGGADLLVVEEHQQGHLRAWSCRVRAGRDERRQPGPRRAEVVQARSADQLFVDPRERARGEVVGHEVPRSEEHTSELQSLMRISYAVFCLKKKKLTSHYHKQSF